MEPSKFNPINFKATISLTQGGSGLLSESRPKLQETRRLAKERHFYELFNSASIYPKTATDA